MLGSDIASSAPCRSLPNHDFVVAFVCRSNATAAERQVSGAVRHERMLFRTGKKEALISLKKYLKARWCTKSSQSISTKLWAVHYIKGGRLYILYSFSDSDFELKVLVAQGVVVNT
jgi:hypothetical protein